MNVNREKIQKMFDEHFIDDCDEVFDASEEIIDFAIKVVKNCSIPLVSESFEIGEKVLHKTTTEVFISDYCEDVEQIEVCCGADYYKVDIDSLVKI